MCQGGFPLPLCPKTGIVPCRTATTPSDRDRVLGTTWAAAGACYERTTGNSTVQLKKKESDQDSGCGQVRALGKGCILK